MKRPAYIDTSEMGLIRKLGTIRINMFLNSTLITTTTSPINVIDSRLDRYPSQARWLFVSITSTCLGEDIRR